MIEVIFLGTSAMQPTKERNHPAVLLMYKGEGLLFDCGENTQRQLKIAGIKPSKITKIFLSHWHGDHVLGLPGILQTMGANEYKGPVSIYGPVGTKKHIEHMLKAFVFDCKLDIQIHEIKDKLVVKTSSFFIEALPVKHTIKTYGFRFIEKDRRRINVQYTEKLGLPEGPLLGKLQQGKDVEWNGKKIKAEAATTLVQGKKIAYVTDTAYCNNAITLAENVDLLICESSYTSALKNKAEEYLHMTAQQAAQIANTANAKKLVLTHFSQRYKNTQEIEEDARDYFDNIICAEDFMRVRV